MHTAFSNSYNACVEAKYYSELYSYCVKRLLKPFKFRVNSGSIYKPYLNQIAFLVYINSWRIHPENELFLSPDFKVDSANRLCD